MFRIFKIEKDTYITDRVIRKQRVLNANQGQAGTLDLFKLYGHTMSGSSPNNELSRILLKFDLTSLKADYASGLLDISNPSFNVSLNLVDVYGGQPTPSNFSIQVYPLSRSFDEGLGQDVVYYQDNDVANFITASFLNGTSNVWFASGANAKGLLGSPDIDVIASGNLGAGIENLWTTQVFAKGTEDLNVDVTKVISATLCGLLPEHGFRVSFLEAQETDTKTRFVKRFGASHAQDPFSRPKLIVRFNDSVLSHETDFVFNTPGTLFLHNFVRGNLTDVLSGSSLTAITGANCMLLKLVTPVSTSMGFINYETFATASQHRVGLNYVKGIYSASLTLPLSDPYFSTKVSQSGSVEFDQVWTSFDKTVTYFSGSITVRPPAASTGPVKPRRYYVNVTNVADEYVKTDTARMKVFIFDYSTPTVKLMRVPIETPSVLVENAFYSIRDSVTDKVVIPFDTRYNSTKLSGDSTTMYFDLWMESLVPGRTYTVDVMVVEGGQQQIYRDASPAFRVVEM